ncbi:MAG: hypothetical protein EA391_07660 [Balneolaceae bacterium]|nr:MAG: hypothetical protein EA391_07660 [Balneolaceae bacterium]
MAAFKTAYEMQADMIELDVQLTADGVPVVFHDENVKKLTNGNGNVKDFTYARLRELDAGSHFSGTYRGEKIPSLQQVLEWLPHEMLLNIEIKPEAVTENQSDGIEEKVIELVVNNKLENRVILSSFSYLAVKRSKGISSRMKTGLLYERSQSSGKVPSVLIEEHGADFFHCSSREMKRSWVTDLQRKKIPFMIYTVNRKWSMKKWMKRGCFGIFSDKPDLLRNVYESTVMKR